MTDIRASHSGLHRGTLAVLAVLAVVMASGCSPEDITGVRALGDDGVVVQNCGTYIRGVDVSDAESSRPIWTARLVEAGFDAYGTDAVVIGRLPDPGWSADGPPALEPRPDIWRFVVETDIGETVIKVRDEDLVPRVVHGVGGATVSESEFEVPVCDEVGGMFQAATKWAFVLLGGALVVVVGGSFGMYAYAEWKRENR